MSNSLLARRAANENFSKGLSPWLKLLDLGKHESSIQTWCEQSGVASADGLVEKCTELTDALELEESERDIIKRKLAAAAPSQIQTSLVDIKLRGKIGAWRR